MVVQTLLQDRLQTVRRKPELRELGFELLHRGHGELLRSWRELTLKGEVFFHSISGLQDDPP